MSDEKVNQAREELMQQRIQQQQAAGTVNSIAASIYARCVNPLDAVEVCENLALKCQEAAFAFASKVLGIIRRANTPVNPVKSADIIPMTPPAKTKKPRKAAEKEGE